MDTADTIAAIASAPGRGAVGLLRVSGPDVPRIARAVLGSLPEARRAHLAPFRNAQGASIDEGIALYFPAPASFTGEHVLELQCHGGVVVMDLLLRRLLELGARMARAGEFSERAFLNGKMDIAQAEAVADLIEAGTHAAARAAVRSMQGRVFLPHHRALRVAHGFAGSCRGGHRFSGRGNRFSRRARHHHASRAGARRLRLHPGGGASGRAAPRRPHRGDRGKTECGQIEPAQRPRGRGGRHRHAGAGHDPRRAAPTAASRRPAPEPGGYRGSAQQR